MTFNREFFQVPKTVEFRRSLWLLGIFFLIVIYSLLGSYSSSRRSQIIPKSATIKHPTSSHEIVRGDTSKKQVIFTFDGGDGAQSGEQILAALAKHHVTGTFFLTGKFVEANPMLVKKMVAQGNEIFSHTYDHPHLTGIDDASIAQEFSRMEHVLQGVTGISPRPYFRAPYGDRDDRVLKNAFKDGYQSVYWTVDALDWEQKQGKTADEVRARILDNLAPGNIYLMHFGDTITGSILDDVFTKIEAQGYKLVSLTQGLK